VRPLLRLRELREKSALTQQELAKRSGVGRATIAGLEAGHRRAQSETARKLAEALGVEPADLYGASFANGETYGAFSALYERTEDGWWVVSVPEIPGAVSQGKTLEEAREMIRDAVSMLLEVRREDAERETEGRGVIREPLAF
jgi:predicted RNase H-like HicB family nuclease